eukprot:6191227-Pleurochrysis_carterae.AAC.3
MPTRSIRSCSQRLQETALLRRQQSASTTKFRCDREQGTSHAVRRPFVSLCVFTRSHSLAGSCVHTSTNVVFIFRAVYLFYACLSVVWISVPAGVNAC